MARIELLISFACPREPTLKRFRGPPLAHGRFYAEHIAGARLEILDECGHMLPYEKTDDFVRLATAFAR